MKTRDASPRENRYVDTKSEETSEKREALRLCHVQGFSSIVAEMVQLSRLRGAEVGHLEEGKMRTFVIRKKTGI